MSKSTLQTEEEIRALFHSLLGNKKIASIEFFPRTGIPIKMTVLTTPLRILYEDCFYWIDAMMIVVDFESRTLMVYKSHPKQKVGKINGWPAPHVRSDGTVCLGTIASDVKRALQSQNWPLVIEFTICLLESCAPHGIYADVLKDVSIKVEKA